MNLNATVNIDTAAATRMLSATARGATEFSKRLREGNIAAADFSNNMPKLALATQRAQKAISDAAVSEARVLKLTAESNFKVRQTEILSVEAAARAVQRAENQKQKALRETAAAAKAAATDANPGASTQLPSQYLARKAVGLGTPDLSLPDVGSLNQTRYALYDVATTLGVLGAALTGTGIAAIGFGVKYESAMAQVQRTTTLAADDPQLANLKQQLLDLSQAIPVGFADLANIASLGAQLGIASQDLDSFTETVAQFSAVTNVSTEKVAQDFGSLAELINVPATQFQNLGSAINYVGVNSVATDAEILNLATSIGASATQAKFGAANVVGLAGALASLRIQPEQARGVILRLFADFDRVVSEGGTELEKYASVLGVTTTAAKALWETDSQSFFDKLLKGLSTAQNLNSTLSDLGVTETREKNVLQRLAGNYDLYAESIQQANQAYTDGTFLGQSYGIVAQTIAARLDILSNTIQNLLAKAGDSLLPALGPILDVVTNIVKALNLIPAPVLGVITGITLLAGGLTLLVAGAAAFVASGFAVQTALKGITAREGETVSLTVGLRGVITELTQAMGVNTAAARINAVTLGSVGTAAKGAVGKIVGKTVAMEADAAATTTATVANDGFKASLLGTPIINIIAGLSLLVPIVLSFASAMDEAEQQAQDAKDAFITAGGGIDSLREALAKDTAAGLAEGYGTLTTKVSDASRSVEENAAEAYANAKAIEELSGRNAELSGNVDGSAGAVKEQTLVLGKNTEAWLQNALANSDSIKELAKYQKELTGLNIDIPSLIRDSLKNDGSYEKDVTAIFEKLNKAIAKAQKDAANGVDGAGERVDQLNAVGTALGGVTDELGNYKSSAENVSAVREILGLPAIGEDAEGAGGAIDEMAASLGVLQDAIQGGSSSFIDYNGIISDSQAASKAWAEQQAMDRDGSTDAWQEWYDGVSVPISDFATRLQEQVTAQQQWVIDVGTLTDRGATAFVTELATMGPEGAAIAAQAVQLTTDQLNQLEVNARVAAFLASDAFKTTFAAGLGATDTELTSLFSAAATEGGSAAGIAAVTAYITAQTNGSDAAAQAILDQYGLAFASKTDAAPEIPFKADLTDADDKLAAFRLSEHNTPIYIPVIPLPQTTNGKPYGSLGGGKDANGGYYEGGPNRKFANGGVATGMYKGRGRGITHTFAERETRWEAYISGKIGQQNRNLQIWGEAGRKLGVDYAPQLASAEVKDPGSTAAAFARGGVDFPAGDTFATASSPSGQVSSNAGPRSVTNVKVVQNYPTTRDPIKKLREDSENLVAGLWGDN